MKVLENLKAKELVAIGALQEMNTIENIVNLSEQLRNETGKSVTIFSKRITMFKKTILRELEKEGEFELN